MRIHVVAPVLRVVFDHEYGVVPPDGAVRNLLYDLSERQVVIGYERGSLGTAVRGPGSEV
jgi:hypothetical protein